MEALWGTKHYDMEEYYASKGPFLSDVMSMADAKRKLSSGKYIVFVNIFLRHQFLKLVNITLFFFPLVSQQHERIAKRPDEKTTPQPSRLSTFQRDGEGTESANHPKPNINHSESDSDAADDEASQFVVAKKKPSMFLFFLFVCPYRFNVKIIKFSQALLSVFLRKQEVLTS